MSQFPDDAFRKAEGSGTYGCVEVAITDHGVGVRDSKAKGAGPVLAFTPHEWRMFLDGVRKREFDLPD